MTTDEKVQWMEGWCKREGLKLSLDTVIGLGQKCVGVYTGKFFPEYMWYEIEEDEYGKETEKRVDPNGDVWVPKDAFSMPGVAVLGTGQKAIDQLFEWLQYFDKNGFHYRKVELEGDYRPYEIAMEDNFHHQIVKTSGDSV